jgi:hypothetical protein
MCVQLPVAIGAVPGWGAVPIHRAGEIRLEKRIAASKQSLHCLGQSPEPVGVKMYQTRNRETGKQKVSRTATLPNTEP